MHNQRHHMSGILLRITTFRAKYKIFSRCFDRVRREAQLIHHHHPEKTKHHQNIEQKHDTNFPYQLSIC